jgi:Mor family transcriptional regulator
VVSSVEWCRVEAAPPIGSFVDESMVVSVEHPNGESKDSPEFKRVRKESGRGERAKRKLGDAVTYDDLVRNWTQCCFLIQHKQRLCNMSRSPNSRYCGNHIHLTDEKVPRATAATDDDIGTDDADERVPCPLDGSHTIFKRNLEAHVKKCNAKKYLDSLSALSYYAQNCNGGEPQLATQVEAKKTLVDLDLLVRKVHDGFNFVELNPLVEIPQSAKVQAADDRIRSTVGGTQTSFKQTRHTDQDIAIVHQLVRHDLLTIDDR